MQSQQPLRFFFLEEASCRILDVIGAVSRSVQHDDEVECGLLLLSSACDHVTQQSEGAGFSCGFRNMQMLLSALQYEGQLYLWPLLQELNPDAAERGVGAGQPLVPDLASMQSWLDHTWSVLGFDADGAAQMGEAVAGTDKWVGAGEAVSLFRSLGVPARPVVLHAFDSPFLGAALGSDAAVLGNVAQIHAAEVLFSTSGLSPQDVLEPWQAPAAGRRGGGSGGHRRRSSSDDGPFDSAASRGPPLQALPPLPSHEARLLAVDPASKRLYSTRSSAAGVRHSSSSAPEVVDVGLTDSDSNDDATCGASKAKPVAAASGAAAAVSPCGEDDDEICVVETVPKPQPVPVPAGAGAGAALPSRARAPPPPAPVSKATAIRRYSLARNATLVQWLLAYFLLPGRDPAAVITSSPAELAAALRAVLAGGLDRRVAPGKLPDGGNPLPLYFQHDGHSRTLVGLELRHAAGSKGGRASAEAAATAASSAALSAWLEGGPAKRPRLEDSATAAASVSSSSSAVAGAPAAADPVLSQLADVDINLLLLDPSTASTSLRQGLAAGKWGRFIRRNINTLRKPVYELVAITRASALRAEAEAELGAEGAVSEEAFARFCVTHPSLSKTVTQDHLFFA